MLSIQLTNKGVNILPGFFAPDPDDITLEGLANVCNSSRRASNAVSARGSVFKVGVAGVT